MTSESAIRESLPTGAVGRVQSVRMKGAVAILVVDAAGLTRPDAERLETEIRANVLRVDGVDDVRIALTAEKRERHIIAIGSGKGGVGKSTLTANLAVALAASGIRTGVVDADIYGPSQPTLLGTQDEKVVASADKVLTPTSSAFGVKTLSMGQLIEPGRAIAWRGPMVGGALTQLMEADWGDTEVLLVDLPPGTGDVQLTMLQKFRPSGAVVVSTPQDLALIDATRALDLFGQAKVPVLGLVENMAGYMCPHCGELSDPFGHGGAEAAAQALGHPFLGRIPLSIEIRLASDAGQPPAAQDTPQGEAFRAIAARIASVIRTVQAEGG
ncbi:Mrp/NBP35 family ATP-binding protein [Paraurantiacibacter namhicola]|uniref:Iron-sulfur cluster carrier protein n=1 Tax=Paraurantiacibacter namhicola TaxID=645517 RepID=A0A1C7D6P2_9SPHN|nr:Mrp/NBP35 family ATP-binding protein [Paraurantiacibacter namhicola]ANU07129.1 antiporter inner membrane protein [Paraurantiacibacter namhicola]